MISIAIIKVRTALQEAVKGEVQVKVSFNDVMYVSIIQNGQRWNWYIEELTEQLHAGVTAQQITDWCLKAYRRYIFSLYLKNS